ncbi:PGF-CTERM sorting domain-containing protein [Haloarchaeobius sp. HME9146]|uniref:PGF-CTERM sorting domain-containing protein n=1 Tax=Haloarchaeobius sp. HME9146 TaxID=2978732 RepID=UPI0021BE0F98|nr:PGF-CTERM sorting domain-containing protein [Haloarchaeobius sp. HME9146]MCT9098133.1 PGF-CTERM sorting domain-containing protein [Haloarchaeobius sp. HME9146]
MAATVGGTAVSMPMQEQAESVDVIRSPTYSDGEAPEDSVSDVFAFGNVTLAGDNEVTGALTAANGTPVDGDTVQLVNPGGRFTLNQTNETGDFTFSTEENGSHELTYHQDGYGSLAPADGIPDVYTFGDVEVSGDTDLGTRSLPAGHNLTVQLEYPNGTRIADAEVRIIHERGEGHVGAERTTDANGTVDIEVTGDIRVYVIPTDHLDYESTDVTMTEDRTVTLTVDPQVQVNGTVTDHTGATVENMWLYYAGDGSYDSNVTDSEGRYTVAVHPNKSHFVRLEQGRAEPTPFPDDGVPGVYVTDPIAVGDGGTHDIQLPKGHDLNVTVQNESGVAIQGVNLSVEAVRNNERTSAPGTTDANGMFVPNGATDPGIEVNGSIAVDIWDTPPGYGETEVATNVTNSTNLTVTLPSAMTVTGTVEGANGTPAASDYVRISHLENNNGETTWTDSNGTFSAEVADSGSYEVEFHQTAEQGDHAESFPQDGIPDFYYLGVVSESDPALGTETLPSANNLTIRVVDQSGDPLSGIRVGLTHEFPNMKGGSTVYTETGPNGTVQAEVVGQIDFYANGKDQGYDSNGTQETVSWDETVTLTLRKTAEVSGQFEYADGTSPSGSMVTLHGSEDVDIEGLSNDGSFTTEVVANDSYELEFDQRDLDSPDRSYPKDGQPDLYVFEDEAAIGASDTDIGTRTLPTAPHLVNVTVTDENGNALADVDVTVEYERNGSAAKASGTTDDNGVVHLQDGPAGIELASGNLTIGVLSHGHPYGYETRTFTIDGDRNITIPLGKNYSVSGRFVDEQSTVLTSGELIVRSDEGNTLVSQQTDQQGRFNITVPAGDYTMLFVQTGGEAGAGPLDGLPDIYEFESPSIWSNTSYGNVTIPDGHVVDPTVVGKAGEPVEDATVWYNSNASGDEYALPFTIQTHADGRIHASGDIDDPAGLELAGPVEFSFEPPEGTDDFGFRWEHRDISVTENRSFELTLPTQEEAAMTTTFSEPIDNGTLSAGTDVTDITVDFTAVDAKVTSVAATFDGQPATAELTRDGDTMTYSATNLSDGSSYSLVVTLTDSLGRTLNKTVNFTVAGAGDGGSGGGGNQGGGGGGGGGQGSGSAGTIKIADWSVSDSTVAPGEQVTLTVTVANNADSTKTITPALYVDGELVEGKRLSVLKGMERTVEFTYRFSEEGTHSLSPDGSDFEFVTVESAGESTTTTATPTTTDSTQTTTAPSNSDDPVTTTESTTVADTTTEPPAEDDADDSGSSSSIPGFGLGPALVALVAAALLAMRRTN